MGEIFFAVVPYHYACIYELAKKLLEKINRDKIAHSLERLNDDFELKAMLKLSDAAFADWDNKEDSVY